MTKDTEAIPYIKPDPDDQEPDDMILSYLNPDCLSADSPSSSSDLPLSSPYNSSSSSLDGSPKENSIEQNPQDFLFDIQNSSFNPMHWTSDNTCLQPDLLTTFPLFLPAQSLPYHLSSYSPPELLSEEQPKKKRGRKKRESPVLSATPAIAPAPPTSSLPSLLPATVKIEPVIQQQQEQPPSEQPPQQHYNPSPTHIASTKSVEVKNEPMTTEQQKAAALAKRQERLIKNRAAALLSRKRKREHLNALEEQNKNLTAENADLRTKVVQLEAQVSTLSKENQELRDRLSAATMNTPSSIAALANARNISTKTTGMVFMIILFSFALFTLPSHTVSRLTVGGAPRQIPLLGSSGGSVLDVGHPTGGKHATLDGPPNTAETGSLSTELIIMESVRPRDLQMWIEDKLDHGLPVTDIKEEEEEDNDEKGLVHWPGRVQSAKHILSSSKASSPRVYLYSNGFSQVAPIHANGSAKDPLLFDMPKQHDDEAIFSLVSPFGSTKFSHNQSDSSHRPCDSTIFASKSQRYLQIDVKVLGSRVIDGELISLEHCPFASSLLSDMKDDLLSPVTMWDAENTSSSVANASSLAKPTNDRRTKKDIRRKIVGEDRAKKIARVIT
ncbi:hypothetical protein EC973_000710 [Apophysomyces ossiformis]|uniref:BZIP domain-containing protein n=1 Tax=Apophysomyces ossiformis TaxID=679940 RepID=A0A8H7BKV0_9FUNG|nr:hypothetical protein EC973_000710 [Apophysomyces ossiformis]